MITFNNKQPNQAETYIFCTYQLSKHINLMLFILVYVHTVEIKQANNGSNMQFKSAELHITGS